MLSEELPRTVKASPIAHAFAEVPTRRKFMVLCATLFNLTCAKLNEVKLNNKMNNSFFILLPHHDKFLKRFFTGWVLKNRDINPTANYLLTGGDHIPIFKSVIIWIIVLNGLD